MIVESLTPLHSDTVLRIVGGMQALCLTVAQNGGLCEDLVRWASHKLGKGKPQHLSIQLSYLPPILKRLKSLGLRMTLKMLDIAGPQCTAPLRLRMEPVACVGLGHCASYRTLQSVPDLSVRPCNNMSLLVFCQKPLQASEEFQTGSKERPSQEHSSRKERRITCLALSCLVLPCLASRCTSLSF
jgi:hypothetical protein